MHMKNKFPTDEFIKKGKIKFFNFQIILYLLHIYNSYN